MPGDLQPTVAPLAIRAFSANPVRVKPGEAITLTWDVEAEAIVILQRTGEGVEVETYEMTAPPPLTITTTLEWGDRVDFVLVASSGASTAQASISIRIGCGEEVWFFSVPPGDCPAGPHTSGSAAHQRFERGRMIWVSWSRQIYVLFEDEAVPAWEWRPDSWVEGMAERTEELSPPEGLHQPVRGFGLVWDDSGTLPRARDRLGWALAPESAFEADFQCGSAPSATCYLSGPAREVFALRPAGSDWFIWTGATPVP